MDVETPEIDVASGGEACRAIVVDLDGFPLAVEAGIEIGVVEGTFVGHLQTLIECRPAAQILVALAGVHPSGADGVFLAEEFDGLPGGFLPSVLDFGEHLVVGDDAVAIELAP